MGWTTSQIICLVIASPVLGPIFLVIWIFATVKSFTKAVSSYLTHSARADLAHFMAGQRIGYTPQRRAKSEIYRQQNAKVFAPLFPGETRLLKLLRRRSWPDSGIYCEVVSEPRREVQYEVVSYDSRNEILSRPIKIDGHVFMVSSDLYLALKHLRTNDVRYLWIEGLSTDGSEKEARDNRQHLQAILRDAFQVTVWLGEAPKKFKRLLPLFDESPNVVFEDRSGSTSHIFGELLESSWWERLWSVQELALPPSAIIQCGQYRIPWTKFAQALDPSYIDDKHLSQASRARKFASARSKYQSGITYENGLMDLAWKFRECQVADDRDRLYALLGLLPEEQQLIKADYSKGFDQLCMDFAQAWINRHGSLLILNMTQRQKRPRGDHSTWYPRWNEASKSTPEFFCGSTFSKHAYHFWQGRFSANGGRPAPDCIHPKDGRLLRLQGFTHDTVAATAPDMYQPRLGKEHADWEECRAGWWEFIQTWTPEDDRVKHNKEFWLAVTAGLVDSNAGTVDYWSVQRATCEKRRLFITQNGQFGVGPSDVTCGDKVCVVFGSPAPFILSECKGCDVAEGSQGENSQQLKTWRFVGDAYVHSIMSYEGDVDEDVKRGRLFVEDFLLCG